MTNANASRNQTDHNNLKYKELTGESSQANNPKNQLPSKLNTSSHSTLTIRINAIIFATLKYESKQPNTSVDYMSKTMTKKGKEIGLSVLPTSDHEKDYKEGFIHAHVSHGDKGHNVTLFRYKIESNNRLSLIDPSSKKVVYTTRIHS